jgi:hypothetical protein
MFISSNEYSFLAIPGCPIHSTSSPGAVGDETQHQRATEFFIRKSIFYK